jgi:hypothetical protein
MSSVLTDAGTTHVTELRNGVLNHRVSQAPVAGSTTFTLTRPTLIGLVTGTVDLGAGIADGTVTVDGDPADLQRLVDLLAPVDPNFAIVTPLITTSSSGTSILRSVASDSAAITSAARTRSRPEMLPLPPLDSARALSLARGPGRHRSLTVSRRGTCPQEICPLRHGGVPPTAMAIAVAAQLTYSEQAT